MEYWQNINNTIEDELYDRHRRGELEKTTCSECEEDVYIEVGGDVDTLCEWCE